jgi:hypothetical protein
MDVWCVCMCLFCVCVVLCLDRGLATSWSLVQRVLPSVKWSWNWNRGQVPTEGCRAIEEEEEEDEDEEEEYLSVQSPFLFVNLCNLERFGSPWAKVKLSLCKTN